MLKVIAVKDMLPLLRLDEPVDIKKIKIYYQESDFGGHLVSPVHKDIQEGMRKAVSHFKNILKVEVNRVQIQRTKNTSAMWLANMKAKVSPGFDTQIAAPGKTINAWVELAKSVFGHSNHTFIAIMTALTEKFGTQPGSSKHKYLLEERDNTIEDFKEILKDDMSVFLYPTHPTVAPYHNEPLFKAFNFSYTALINMLGMPACTIPLGLGSEGLPVGIQAIANYNNDRLCLAVACELEKAFGGWRAPEMH
jgi:fatty acid amide hydrolase 2